jgi:diguanylate cyclase (GGDEF)-like protein/PAS domain S-box-containing protein
MGLEKRGLPGQRVARLAGLFLALALVAGVAGWAIQRDEAGRRAGLADRFDARVGASARFVEAYVDEVMGRMLRLALSAFTGDVRQEQFELLASTAGFRTAGLFDNRERMMAVLPATPQLIGTTSLGNRLPTLRAALDGTAGVSDVITSVATGERIAFFAVPFFAGDQGWRVFSGSYPVAQTPFEGYLVSAVPFRPYEAYLVDTAGAVVASTIPRLRPVKLGEHRPALAQALARGSSGFAASGENGGREYFSSVPVARTPWRLVFTTPESTLYAPLQGASWVPWTILVAFVLAGVAGIGVVERYLAQRARLRTVLATSDDAFVGMDAQGRITDWNRAAADVFGWSAKEVIGRTVAEVLVPPRLRPAHDAGLSRFLASGERTLPARVELSALHRDGHEVPVEMSLSALRWEGDWYFHAFVRDISERRDAQAALVEAERRFRVAFDMAPVGMALTSLDEEDLGRLLRVNRALSGILGYTVDELEQRTLADVTHPDDRASLLELTQRLHDTAADAGTEPGEPGGPDDPDGLTFQKRCLHADGHLLWVELHTSAIDDAVGACHYAVTQIDDVTDRRAETERLSALALQDPLTGLANRSLLTDRLDQALTRTARTYRPVAVLMCDLDGFKPVNDSHGHAAGDEILREVAARLREVVRTSDTVARIGGDEFVVLCEDLDQAEIAEVVARRIRQRLREEYTLDDGTVVRLSGSVGIATGGGPNLAAEALLEEADRAMYAAKRETHAEVVVDVT